MRRPTGRFRCARPRTPARAPPTAPRDGRRRDTRRRASAALPRQASSAPPRPAPADKQPRRRSRQRCRPPRRSAWRTPARTRGPAADGFPLRRGRVAAGHAHRPCGTPPPAAPPRLRRTQCRPQPLRGAGRREASGGRRENGASERVVFGRVGPLDLAWLTSRPSVAACGDLSLPGRGGLGAADRANSSLAPPSDRLNHSLAITALSLRAADPAEFGPQPAVYSRLPLRVEGMPGGNAPYAPAS